MIAHPAHSRSFNNQGATAGAMCAKFRDLRTRCHPEILHARGLEQ